MSDRYDYARGVIDGATLALDRAVARIEVDLDHYGFARQNGPYNYDEARAEARDEACRIVAALVEDVLAELTADPVVASAMKPAAPAEDTRGWAIADARPMSHAVMTLDRCDRCGWPMAADGCAPGRCIAPDLRRVREDVGR